MGSEPTSMDGAAGAHARTVQDGVGKLFEMTSDLLATVSLDGRFTLLNPAWEQLLGWTREELQSRPVSDFVHPEDAEQLLGPMRAGAWHGAFCLGCCWMLMGLLFVGGLMNLLWIAGLALLVLIEKLFPLGPRGSQLTGVALIGWGAFVLVH